MSYEFKLFDQIIDGNLSPYDENKDIERYTAALKQRHLQSFNLIQATFKKSKSKFVLQTSKKINSLHPAADKFFIEQLDLFQNMPVNELSLDVFKSLDVDAKKVISVHYKQLPSSTVLHIKQSFTWQELSFEEAKYYYYNDLLKNEITRIKESIKENVFSFKSTEKAEHYIHKIQQELINLCFRLMKLLNQSEQNDIYRIAVNFSNIDILNLTFISLEELLRFCEKNYFNYIDKNIQIPYRCSLFKIYNIPQKLTIVKAALLNAKISNALLQIIYAPFLKLTSLTVVERMTYKELIYLNTYLQAFYDEIIENNNAIDEPQIHELLYKINYNSFDLQFYKTAIITRHVETLESIPEIIDYLYHRLKLVNQRRCKVNIAYDRAFPSLKDQLTTWIEEEINYFNKKLALQSKRSGANLFTETDKTKLEIGLTVAQMALFYKLQVDVGIITHKAQQDIFKHISESYHTANALDISQGSIKNKFYNFDTSTIEVLKQKTIEILNQLKSQ